ncbi:MAG: hypothetical protein GVY05_08965 [Bacteroidetes bacterium]|nr:hypothetical protein [Bacteroidota bacterium]
MKQRITNWSEIMFNSLNDIFSKIADILPNILGAFIILVIGWVFTKLILFILTRLFKLIKLESQLNKLKQKSYISSFFIKLDLIKVILSFIKFTLYIIIISIVFEVLGWDSISQKIIDLLDYLPSLVSGLVIFVIGINIAAFVKKSLNSLFQAMDLVYGKLISQIAYYILAIIITITSLNQAGVDTSIITNNLTIVLAAFLLTITLALGLGSRGVVDSILQSFYSKKRFEVGQIVKLEDGQEGVIVAIDSIYYSIDIGDEIMIIPIKKLSEQKVWIKKKDKE